MKQPIYRSIFFLETLFWRTWTTEKNVSPYFRTTVYIGIISCSCSRIASCCDKVSIVETERKSLVSTSYFLYLKRLHFVKVEIAKEGFVLAYIFVKKKNNHKQTTNKQNQSDRIVLF